jgi:uncharacterized protein YjbJ (UPF0337 family)
MLLSLALRCVPGQRNGAPKVQAAARAADERRTVELRRGSAVQMSGGLLRNWRAKMDWNRVEGNWKQAKGKVKEKWGKLTDDDLDVVAGRRDQLEGKIQERYGIAKDQVRKDVDSWINSQNW